MMDGTIRTMNILVFKNDDLSTHTRPFPVVPIMAKIWFSVV